MIYHVTVTSAAATRSSHVRERESGVVCVYIFGVLF